jgi:DMSO/TMAO reductase YedYZ molybdopterin-dependent catalytic subunit
MSRNQSRRSFLIAAAGTLTGLAGWEWLTSRTKLGGVPYPLRRTLDFNEQLARSAFDPDRLAPTLPREMAREPRVNGEDGLTGAFDPATWRLEARAGAAAHVVDLAELRRFPRVEMTTELHCIEGWSVPVNWAGCRMRDVIAHYPGHTPGRFPYVGLQTPDAGYYVGLDMASALHPQTLLCYEMNGQPLPLVHGGPLRLVTTVKYGIKSIKRIGRITLTDARPADFWAERGYDWYAGL